MNAYTLKLEPLFQLDLSKFYQFCCQNPDIQFERNAQGEIIILSPTGGETGKTNFNLALKIGIWNERTKLGVCFDSSTCFRLPNGAERSPDVSWVAQSTWDKLTLEEKTKFPPLAPDFVLELMSPSDRLKDTQEKRSEYRSNGVKLGWLINPKQGQVEIYRLGKQKQVLNHPESLSGENILPGFVLDVKIIW